MYRICFYRPTEKSSCFAAVLLHRIINFGDKMNPAFTIKLDQQVLSGLVVTGKCQYKSVCFSHYYLFANTRCYWLVVDGKVPSIACATTGGKILIHSPHDVTNTDGQLSAIRYLNLNRKITALAAGLHSLSLFSKI